ncbi:MAG: thiamine phosphate synthase [Dehalococcoidia bacterium]
MIIEIGNNPILCLVTNRNRTSKRDLGFIVNDAISGGVNMVQFRDREMKGPKKLEMAISLKDLTKDKAMFMVNGDVDLAKEVAADGIHFPEGQNSDANYQNLKKKFIIGRSVHSFESAVKAASEGMDYLTVGTIFPSNSHPNGETSGTEIIEEISNKLSIPLIGIGGISEGNCLQVMEAGAAGVAVIGAISEAASPKLAAHDIFKVLKSSKV